MMIVIVTKMTKTVTTMRVTMSVDQIVQEWPSMPAFITWLQSILFRSVEQSTSSSSTSSSSSATTLTGMIHLTFDQVLYEPIFWALSRWVICFWIQVCFDPLFCVPFGKNSVWPCGTYLWKGHHAVAPICRKITFRPVLWTPLKNGRRSHLEDLVKT